MKYTKTSKSYAERSKARSEALNKASEIHIVEKDGDEVVRDYIATIERVSDVNALIL